MTPHKFSLMLRLVAFLVAAIFWGCQKKGANQLTVGMELSYPPFEMTDEQGQPKGVSVDLAHALGEALNRNVVIQNIPFDGLIPALKTGKIDLIISSMTSTPERAKSIAFSDPYLKTGLCLLVGKNSDIQAIADVDRPDKAVVTKLGTTGHAYAQSNIHQAKTRVLEKESEAVLEVAQGKADAFIYDQMSTFKNWQRNADTTRPILQPFQEESWAIGVRQGNDELRKEVNTFLKDYRAHGGFEALGERHLKEQKDAFKKMGISFFF